jgi:AcrR family transcriptional regulator
MSTKPSPHDRGGVARWRSAALEALAKGGVEAVAIEPLAKSLGVTKGSGYWHFENREALLRAALEEWEALATERIIARLRLLASARERLERLFRETLTATLDSRLYLALIAAREQPTIAAALRRVARRRVAFLAECYEEMGHARREARQRAVTAYATYLGLVTLHQTSSEITAQSRVALVDHVIRVLV